MRFRVSGWWPCLFLLPTLSACRSEAPEATPLAAATAVAEPVAAAEPADPAPPADGAAAAEVNVTVVRDAAALKEAIAALKGRPVMVNFWATWCSACVEEFPQMVAAWQAVKDQDVALVTVSGDFPDDLDAKVKPYLAEHGVRDHAFLTDAEDDVKFIDEFGDGFDGTFPTTITYGRSGQHIASHLGEASRAQFDALLQQAIAAE